MIYFRSIIFYLGEALSTIPFTIISAAVFFAPPRIRSRVIAGWAVFVVWWLKVCCGLRHEVVGRENIPGSPVCLPAITRAPGRPLQRKPFYRHSRGYLKKNYSRFLFLVGACG